MTGWHGRFIIQVKKLAKSWFCFKSDLEAKDTSSLTTVFESLLQSSFHWPPDGAVLLPMSCRYWLPVCAVCASGLTTIEEALY